MLGLGDGKDAGRKRILPRMSVGSFYGSGLTGALLKIRERSLKQRYAVCPFSSDCAPTDANPAFTTAIRVRPACSRASVAKEFGKQQLAYDFCDGHTDAGEVAPLPLLTPLPFIIQHASCRHALLACESTESIALAQRTCTSLPARSMATADVASS